MLESELQERIEDLVSQGALFDAIENTETVDPSMYSHENESFIPSFPIDFLMRRNALFAARHVLDRLHSLEKISVSNKSISLDRKERLFPDLLLCNRERSVLILMELKRSGQTAREAITELLAYEHEVRNHLPYLSNLDICHVIVSTDYTALLDHSVAGLLTWESKQILCLKAIATGGQLKLRVHIPSSWTSIGQGTLPPDAISTAVLCLHEDDESPITDDRKFLQTAHTAVDLIAREGDRSNSHGFIMLWEDSWYGGLSQTRYNLSIGVVNPFSFVPAAINSEFLSADRSPLTRYVMEKDRFRELCPVGSVHGRVCEKAIHLFKEQCNPLWERFCSWDRDRSPSRNERDVTMGLNHRAIPLRFEFWGALGDFARQYITMPTVRNTFDPAIRKHALDWTTPSVAIDLLDRITGMDIVKNGKFNCKTMFEIGFSTGAFLSIAGTVASTPDNEQKNLPASFEWYGALFGGALKEIGMRWMSTNDVVKKPPTIRFACCNGSPTAEHIQSFIEWMNVHFLDGFDVHKTCFQIGLNAVYILDPYFSACADETHKQEIVESIGHFGRQVIGRSIDEANNDSIGDDIRQRLTILLEEEGFPRECAEEVSDETIVQGLSGPLFDLLDTMCFPVIHSIAHLAKMNIDWGWIREQVMEMRNRGIEYAGIVVAADGTFGVADLQETGGFLSYDAASEVIVHYDIGGGIPIISAFSWEDLENGKLFEKPTARSTPDFEV